MTAHDSETPAHGQQVITAVAFIHHDFNGTKMVFLARRAKTKKFLPDVFEMPGGHVDYGEDIVVGLKREVMEEFGKTISVGDPFAVFTYTNKVKGSHSIEVAYFAQFIGSLEDITFNPEDHSEFGWYSEDQLGEIKANRHQEDDPEVNIMRKGFALLNGQKPHY